MPDSIKLSFPAGVQKRKPLSEYWKAATKIYEIYPTNQPEKFIFLHRKSFNGIESV
jgi:hypothetical protein